MTTPKTALLPYIISLPVKFYPDFSPFQISVMNQFIHINRYQICLDPTISLSVLYSGLFARNNRISNASFPNRFNPSVKHFNFELIIHNPCHNSTTSRIKINNPVCLGILPVNSYAPEPMIPFFFQEIQALFARSYFIVQYIALLLFFLILLYNFLYYIPFIVHIIFYTTIYCTLSRFSQTVILCFT